MHTRTQKLSHTYIHTRIHAFMHTNTAELAELSIQEGNKTIIEQMVTKMREDQERSEMKFAEDQQKLKDDLSSKQAQEKYVT